MRTYFTAFNFTDNTVSFAESAGISAYKPHATKDKDSANLGLILGLTAAGVLILVIIIIIMIKKKNAKPELTRRTSSVVNEDTQTEEDKTPEDDLLNQPLNISENMSRNTDNA